METYNSEDSSLSSQQFEKDKKPGGLIFAGVLSIMNAFIWVIGGIGMILLTKPEVKELLYDLLQEMDQIIPSSFDKAMEYAGTSGTILIVGSIISFIGIIGILMLKKNGFFIYVLAQIGLIVTPLILQIPNSFSVWGVLMTVLFIGIYASFWKLYK